MCERRVRGVCRCGTPLGAHTSITHAANSLSQSAHRAALADLPAAACGAHAGSATPQGHRRISDSERRVSEVRHIALSLCVRRKSMPAPFACSSHLTSLRPCMLCADKKKNGLKSALVKCYVERIVEDHHNLLDEVVDDGDTTTGTAGGVRELHCPTCTSRFAREASIHGRPALKMVGGKVRMRK